ncbi:MAG: histidinol-phosphate aminotransferase family protein [Acidimicrobiia bacterium]|nr:histidinol-phosphate aminotransferase family protein [Acidimicrobiia bacterium]MYF83229.1 histidinol-phosphate aminotransferase family protein [Acidimicrobiia bacterium]
MPDSRPVHGGLDVAELKALGLRPEEVVDFSASINPLGVSPRVAEAIRRVDLSAYPDPESTELRDALSSHLGVPPDRILVGNGSTELIQLVASARLRRGGSAAVFAPTFGEYEAACRLQHVEPRLIRAACERESRWDMPEATHLLAELQPALVFICNPNNPTGAYLERSEVEACARAVGGDGLLVVDEAYAAFVDERWDPAPLLEVGNVALVRSMTKQHGLPGLRLGYMVASARMVREARRFQYTWSVNAVAQAAGVAALDDPDHVEKGRLVVRAAREYLVREIRGLGLECTPPSANFLLVEVGDATPLRLELLRRHRVCVRDCTSFGMPGHIRIGVRGMQDSRRLIDALTDVLGRSLTSVH